MNTLDEYFATCLAMISRMTDFPKTLPGLAKSLQTSAIIMRKTISTSPNFIISLLPLPECFKYQTEK